MKGYASRDDYAEGLRGYQQYIEDVRSDHRDRAAAFSEHFEYLVTRAACGVVTEK